MAILKHYPMKTCNYTEAIRYLIFEHDEFTQKERKNENGSPIMREEYLLDGINCDPYSYDAECFALNNQFHKNQAFKDVKQHHYIISFDPKDATDCGLTCEKAQSLGLEYARKNFPGHQTLVCTHADGHNHSGNIHVHIVFNSLRKCDVDERSFMERPCDRKAGYKHHETKDLMRYLKQDLMELCQREHLHQVNLLRPAKARITDREYYKNKRGNDVFDQIIHDAVSNISKKDDAQKSAPTKFQTLKEQLRQAIREASFSATSEEDFAKILLAKYDITLKVSRGRYSYLPAGRQKAIRGRSLGSDYEETFLRTVFEKNRIKQENARNEAPAHEEKQSIMAQIRKQRTASRKQALPYEFTMHSRLRLVIDLQTNAKAQANRAYARKVRITNLQEMAKTIAFIQENNIATIEQLDAIVKEKRGKTASIQRGLQIADKQLHKTNEQIRYTGQYLANRNTYRSFLQSKNKGAYRIEHEKEIEKYEEARDYLRKHSNNGKTKMLSELKGDKQKLAKKRNLIKEKYNACQKEQKLYETVQKNVAQILNPPEWEKKQSHDI